MGRGENWEFKCGRGVSEGDGGREREGDSSLSVSLGLGVKLCWWTRASRRWWSVYTQVPN